MRGFQSYSSRAPGAVLSLLCSMRCLAPLLTIWALAREKANGDFREK